MTGKNLAQVCREDTQDLHHLYMDHDGIAIISSDIQEVVNGAIAFKILFGWKLWVCVVTGLDTFTFLLLHVLGTRVLEVFFTSYFYYVDLF